MTEGTTPLSESHDGENPYAPPQSAPGPAAGAGLPFTVYDVFHWSWSTFSERMSTCLSIFWGIAGISLLASLSCVAVQEALESTVRDEYLYKTLYIIVMFLNYVFQFWLGIGLTVALIRIARDEPVSIDDITSGGRNLLTVILAWIVHKLLLAVPIAAAVGVIAGGIYLLEIYSGITAGPLILAEVLLFLVVSGAAGIVFIILATRLSIYYYLVIDQGAGVFDSLLESWRLCRNQVGTITLVYCIEFAIVLAGVLAFCVGVIFAFPLISLLDAVLYLAIVTCASSGPTKPQFSLAGNMEPDVT